MFFSFILVPGPPSDVKLKVSKPREVHMSWSPPTDLGDGVDAYVVEWYSNDGRERNITLGNIKEYTIYQ